jgi:hypothetical protein
MAQEEEGTPLLPTADANVDSNRYSRICLCFQQLMLRSTATETEKDTAELIVGPNRLRIVNEALAARITIITVCIPPRLASLIF